MLASIDEGARRLREMLKDPNKTIVAPGVYDGLTARIALATGFECLYMTGAGTAMSRLGMPDLGLATFNDMYGNAAMIASLSNVPLIADADTGYGGPISVARTVSSYARAGVAGLHIEDQVQEKRCGHLMGKQLVDRDIWYSKLRAAITARDEIGSQMVIIARTDARAVLGFEEAVERLKGAEKLGVDVLFFEALQSREEARKACEIFKNTPMLLNMVPSGVTPNMTAEEAKEIGFRVIIFPSACIAPVIASTKKGLQDLKRVGGMDTESIGPREGFMMCGLAECIAIDEKAGGSTYGNV